MKPICLIASSEEFLLRHFSPAIEAAKLTKADVIAIVPEPRNDGIRFDGLKTIRSPTVRAHNSPKSIIGEAKWYLTTMRQLDPALVVVYSLRMCLILALVQFFFRSCKFVYVITGVGLLGISQSLKPRLTRRLVFGVLNLASRERSHFIFENSSDAFQTGIAAGAHKFSIFMGAGVDPDEFRSSELPVCPPFRFAVVSRLIWSKGIDIAVDAVSSLAEDGHPVELHIYGKPDFANPHPIDPELWVGRVGIQYHGHCDRVAAMWQGVHAGIFVSRGGEGLPRALLEASACGRASIVTSVPGCRDFVGDGQDGYVVPANSVSALKDAILRLINSPHNLRALGKAARGRVLVSSTNDIIRAKYKEIFDSLLQDAQAPKRRATGRVAMGGRQVLCVSNDDASN